MDKVTIHLPAASPNAYLTWVTWWRDVEELLGSDLGKVEEAGDPGPAVGEEARAIVPHHVRLIEDQARVAVEEGEKEISPELSAEPEAWDQWLEYWTMRREWLEALSLRGLPVPEFPEDLVALWQETLDTIEVELAIELADLHNLEFVGTGAPGTFRLVGELEVMNVEVVGRHLEATLRRGERLTLDVSGLTFMDSRGLALILKLAQVALEVGVAPIVLKAPSEVVQRVLEVGVPTDIPGVQIEP
jgi:anti-anti-sigma factor